MSDGRKLKISVTLHPEIIQYKNGQYIDCRRQKIRNCTFLNNIINMKNLFSHLAPAEVDAAGIPRLELSTQTNYAIDAIFNSALNSGYPQEKENRPSSINTLTHMRHVQDESADFSKVAEECVLVFMPGGSDDLIANISEWDDYCVEVQSWPNRVPGCNFALHPTLRTLSSDSDYFVFEHETPYEFQYSLDGNYPHDIYVAFIFKECVLAVKYRN